MKNISELDKNNCTGCRMCEKICPVNAIKMIENKEGFIEPKVDEEVCISCGLCARRCPQINSIENNDRLDKIEVYAAKNVNVEEQKESSSGGIFSVLANYVLDKNGTVYGCAFNDDLVAEHIRIDNKKELYKLRGSKYVQSNTRNTFVEVKEDLLNDKYVLYSGTPCQIAGLKSYLGKEYERLILIDILCHGVPSPYIFEKYKFWLEKKYNSKIYNYSFRNKEKLYWGLGYGIKLKLKDKFKYINGDEDKYMYSFSKGITLREVCYNCKYCNKNRIGDITIGDFWGIEKIYPRLYDKYGVSLVIINSLKGKMIFKELCSNLNFEEIPFSIIKDTTTLNNPCEKHVNRSNIYEKIKIDGIEKTLKIKSSLRIKAKLKKMIPDFVKLKIRQWKININ